MSRTGRRRVLPIPFLFQLFFSDWMTIEWLDSPDGFQMWRRRQELNSFPLRFFFISFFPSLSVLWCRIFSFFLFTFQSQLSVWGRGFFSWFLPTELNRFITTPFLVYPFDERESTLLCIESDRNVGERRIKKRNPLPLSSSVKRKIYIKKWKIQINLYIYQSRLVPITPRIGRKYRRCGWTISGSFW